MGSGATGGGVAMTPRQQMLASSPPPRAQPLIGSDGRRPHTALMGSAGSAEAAKHGRPKRRSLDIRVSSPRVSSVRRAQVGMVMTTMGLVPRTKPPAAARRTTDQQAARALTPQTCSGSAASTPDAAGHGHQGLRSHSARLFERDATTPGRDGRREQQQRQLVQVEPLGSLIVLADAGFTTSVWCVRPSSQEEQATHLHRSLYRERGTSPALAPPSAPRSPVLPSSSSDAPSHPDPPHQQPLAPPVTTPTTGKAVATGATSNAAEQDIRRGYRHVRHQTPTKSNTVAGIGTRGGAVIPPLSPPGMPWSSRRSGGGGGQATGGTGGGGSAAAARWFGGCERSAVKPFLVTAA
jgi:hypothetical protein